MPDLCHAKAVMFHAVECITNNEMGQLNKLFKLYQLN